MLASHQVVTVARASYTMPSFFSDEARDLIGRILVLDPKDRITLQEIDNHPWMRGTSVAPTMKHRDPHTRTRTQSSRAGMSAREKRVSHAEGEEYEEEAKEDPQDGKGRGKHDKHSKGGDDENASNSAKARARGVQTSREREQEKQQQQRSRRELSRRRGGAGAGAGGGKGSTSSSGGAEAGASVDRKVLAPRRGGEGRYIYAPPPPPPPPLPQGVRASTADTGTGKKKEQGQGQGQEYTPGGGILPLAAHDEPGHHSALYHQPYSADLAHALENAVSRAFETAPAPAPAPALVNANAIAGGGPPTTITGAIDSGVEAPEGIDKLDAPTANASLDLSKMSSVPAGSQHLSGHEQRPELGETLVQQCHHHHQEQEQQEQQQGQEEGQEEGQEQEQGQAPLSPQQVAVSGGGGCVASGCVVM